MKKSMVILILGSAGLALLGGCSMFIDKPKTVVLKHPVTLDFVNCNVDKWETTGSYEANDQCIKDYQAKGYEVWGTRQ